MVKHLLSRVCDVVTYDTLSTPAYRNSDSDLQAMSTALERSRQENMNIFANTPSAFNMEQMDHLIPFVLS